MGAFKNNIDHIIPDGWSNERESELKKANIFSNDIFANKKSQFSGIFF